MLTQWCALAACTEQAVSGHAVLSSFGILITDVLTFGAGFIEATNHALLMEMKKPPRLAAFSNCLMRCWLGWCTLEQE
jgi:hypothetical protein